MYSEPLDFVKNDQHTRFLVAFLTGFMATPQCRGRDPAVEESYEESYGVHIRHAGATWAEQPNPLWYRPCLVGRHIRVGLVRNQDKPLKTNIIMKSTWEEILPPESSPPSEVEVLGILLKANVRGLPKPYSLESAIVRDDGGSEVQTRDFPEDCEVAFPATTKKNFEKMQECFVSHHTSKPLAPGAEVNKPYLRRVQIQRQQFNKPLEVRRQLTRVLMSYCVPLKEAMRNRGPETLMRIIRDAMIVYYEAYKLPESGFIHGGKHFMNIFGSWVLMNNLNRHLY